MADCTWTDCDYVDLAQLTLGALEYSALALVCARQHVQESHSEHMDAYRPLALTAETALQAAREVLEIMFAQLQER